MDEFVEINTRNGDKFSNYKINKKGEIINKYNVILRQQIHNKYYNVRFKNDDNKRMTFNVHRLVGLTFLDNPNNYEIINHIDENKLNNNAGNLEWVTHRQNIIHSCGKKINKIDIKTNKILKTYSSITDAGIDVSESKNNNANISKALNKKTKSSCGFKWEYAK